MIFSSRQLIGMGQFCRIIVPGSGKGSPSTPSAVSANLARQRFGERRAPGWVPRRVGPAEGIAVFPGCREPSAAGS